MSNEELVEAIQGGDQTRTLELWAQVRRLVARQAYRWRGVGRLETDDFMQAGFLALLRAVDTYDGAAGAAFSTWLFQHIRAEFTEATGQKNERQRMDPLHSAASLDAPLGTEADGETLADVLPDPESELALEAVGEGERIARIHAVIEEALAELPEAQQEAIRREYWLGVPADRKAHNAALRALRNPRYSKRLRAYL